jgi:4-amino-4-deoxy-L-arabinose transferase-like glycosyltransferase
MLFSHSDRLTKISKPQFVGLLVFISLLALIIHHFAARPWGIGVTQDSVFYFSAAENFLAGNGISWTGGGGEVKTLIHFPPLYPLTIAIVKVVLREINLAAAWINTALFGFSTYIVGLVIYAVTKSRFAGVVGGMIALISPVLLEVHLDAMSEPLYLLWVFLSLALIHAYNEYRKIYFILIAAASSALAVLTRYVGISVIATGGLMLLIWYPSSLRRRVIETFRYTIMVLIPVALWYIRNFIHTGSFTNRSIGIHPITFNAVSEGITSLSSWFLPDSVSLDLRVVFALFGLLGIGGILVSIAMNRGSGGRIKVPFNTQIISILVLHSVVYSLLLIFSISFVDASTRLENRILLPLYFIALILAIICITWLISRPNWQRVWVKYFLGLSLVAITAAIYLPRQSQLIKDMRSEGRGFSGRSWVSSEIIIALRRLDPESTVYSNEAFSVLYLTGIPARWIPEKFDPVKAIERENFDEQMARMRENLSQPDSVMAVFHQGYLKSGMPSLEEIMEGLVIVHESRDGIILVNPRNEPSWSFP